MIFVDFARLGSPLSSVCVSAVESGIDIRDNTISSKCGQGESSCGAFRDGRLQSE